MKTRSAKAKGRRLQNKIRDFLLEEFKELGPDDIPKEEKPTAKKEDAKKSK